MELNNHFGKKKSFYHTLTKNDKIWYMYERMLIIIVHVFHKDTCS